MPRPTSSSETAPHRLPTNSTTKHHPVHRWLSFVAGFSPEFVSSAINAAGVNSSGLLLDPFAGMGTALVTANAHGLDAVGYEPHPFFSDIAIAKVSTRDGAHVDTVESILSSVRPVTEIQDVWGSDACTFLSKLVDVDNLTWLAGARLAEQFCPPDVQKLYRLVVSRLLEGAAGAKTDGIYKAPTTSKRSVNIAETSQRLMSQIRDDIQALTGDQQLFAQAVGNSQIYTHTAERMPELDENIIDICVTSPPYLNNFDFAEMTRMELYFWNYATNWREITDRVRGKLIINTTTAPTVERRQQDYWASKVPGEMLDDLIEIRKALREQRALRPGKKEYDTLVLPYFAQMYTIITEVYRVLKPGAPFHLVVSDAALYGVHIHTEELLAQLMTIGGLEVKDIIRLRDRGGRWVLAKRQGAADGLGEFHIYATKAG